MCKYEFISDKLDYRSIEDAILTHYNLDNAHSSTFVELKLGINKEQTIFAEKGIISFNSIVGATIDSKYIVTVIPKRISRNIW